jgi:hypothetical protein
MPVSPILMTIFSGIWTKSVVRLASGLHIRRCQPPLLDATDTISVGMRLIFATFIFKMDIFA